MSFLKNMLFGGEGHACAHNAHLAEIVLRSLPAARRPEVVLSLGTVLRRGWEYKNLEDHQLAEAFDAFPRVTQLNLLAIAMKDLGIGWPREQWLHVRNPIFTLMDTRDIEVSAGHFERKHGRIVAIHEEPMSIGQWLDEGLLVRRNIASPAAPPKQTKPPPPRPAPAVATQIPVQAATTAPAEQKEAPSICYLQGIGVEKDYPRALRMFIEEAARGDKYAMNNIGVVYKCGYGVTVNYAEAMNWFKKAADVVSVANLSIAQLYAEGLGVTVDRLEAYRWNSRAIAMGEANAKAARAQLLGAMTLAEVVQLKQRGDAGLEG
ncbi:tetratricopeptide repeat protein [Paraburkholderia bryophila]|uniref:Sel1 repeat-containing protein n=1 Tax=Paraburkholderia bryophila TaxID=420952 RepID=A0A329BQN1_9BURK|nr:tetratricopeptide repeat protein [Paraburkholderia bryophila]RAS21235.1 Sel1 repeat-containing protein [Paraburkholderia bryophila]